MDGTASSSGSSGTDMCQTILNHLITFCFDHKVYNNVDIVNALKQTLPILYEKVTTTQFEKVSQIFKDLPSIVNPFLINAQVKDINQYEKEDERRLCFDVALLLLFQSINAADSRVHSSQILNLNDFITQHPSFNSIQNINDKIKLLNFRNTLKLVLFVVPSKANKGRLMHISIRIAEGRTAYKHNSFGCASVLEKKWRASIIEKETGLTATKRERKREKRGSEEIDDDVSHNSSVSGKSMKFSETSEYSNSSSVLESQSLDYFPTSFDDQHKLTNQSVNFTPLTQQALAELERSSVIFERPSSDWFQGKDPKSIQTLLNETEEISEVFADDKVTSRSTYASVPIITTTPDSNLITTTSGPAFNFTPFSNSVDSNSTMTSRPTSVAYETFKSFVLTSGENKRHSGKSYETLISPLESERDIFDQQSSSTAKVGGVRVSRNSDILERESMESIINMLDDAPEPLDNRGSMAYGIDSQDYSVDRDTILNRDLNSMNIHTQFNDASNTKK